MGVGERSRSRWIVLAVAVAGLIALAGPQARAMLSPAPPNPAPTQAWSVCAAPEACRPVDLSNVSLDAPVTTLTTTFVADRRALEAPLAIHIAAVASAEVWWNGARIGANGRVGPDRAHEIPGRFSAVIPVPQDRVRPGENRVEVRMSAHHLWAPVRRPIHALSIGPYGDPLRGTLRHYLPTLLMTGLLGLAFLGAAALWLLGRTPGAATMTLLSGAVVAQAGVEASKLALTYLYPWQLARLAAVAGLAALAAFALARLSLVFAPDRRLRRALTAILAVALLLALFGPPWWDAKALWAFRAGVAIALVGATAGALSGVKHARAAQVACVLGLALSWSPNFLDSGYYLLCLTLFGRLAFTTVRDLRAPAATPRSTSDATLSIPDGASRHLIKAGDLLHVRADDDYGVVTLTDGRELLSTANLSALVRLAPEHLLRIHRSHAINPARIVAIHRSGKAGRGVELQGGARLPVGRTYWAALNERTG